MTMNAVSSIRVHPSNRPGGVAGELAAHAKLASAK